MERFRTLTLTLVVVILALPCSALAAWPDDLRVVTYNIHHGEGIDKKFDLERIAKVMLAEKPDIVAVQEVDQKTRRASGVDQPAELARLTGMKVVFGKNIDFEGGGYGTAVLTNIPVRSSESIKLKSYYAPTKENPEQRGVQILELGTKDGPELTFMCTHLDYRPPDDERMNSALTINELVRKRPNQPTVIAGDFNAQPDSRVIREFAKEWKIAGMELEGAKQRPRKADALTKAILTIPVTKPERWIDYVMCRPAKQWEVVEVRVLDEAVASDHRALVAVLKYVP